MWFALLWLMAGGTWHTYQLKRVKRMLRNTMQMALNDGRTIDRLEVRADTAQRHCDSLTRRINSTNERLSRLETDGK